MHAKKTRDRKKLFLDEAELTIARMEAENASLRAFMRANGMAPQSDAVPAPQPQPAPLLAAATAPTAAADVDLGGEAVAAVPAAKEEEKVAEEKGAM